MTEYMHGGHTKYDIKYHIVWITKYRYKILTPEMGRRLKELLIQGCTCRGIVVVKGHIDTDHVHLLPKICMEILTTQGYRHQKPLG
jgi:putative transposase